jgi:hypothetical protein
VDGAAWTTGRTCGRTNRARCPDLVKEIIHTRKREAKHGFVDEAAVAHLLMHAADHDLGRRTCANAVLTFNLMALTDGLA